MYRSNSNGEWMVLVSFSGEENENKLLLLEAIKKQFPQVVSLLYTINQKKNDTLQDLEIITYFGLGHITENLADIEYKIRPQSFFQTNTQQAEVLYNVALNMATLTGKELVFDLYTGTGSIALFVSKQARKVVGIEYVEEAIQDARENMVGNHIENCEFFAGDMRHILTKEFCDIQGKPDVVITDPPRDGMHQDVVKQLLDLEAEKIVYISCNPATQARDAILLAEKYDLIEIQPVDMFPHTHHVENVGMWMLRK
jgi:23S rRNA (uracil1939-C5)-methyltransferase